MGLWLIQGDICSLFFQYRSEAFWPGLFFHGKDRPRQACYSLRVCVAANKEISTFAKMLSSTWWSTRRACLWCDVRSWEGCYEDTLQSVSPCSDVYYVQNENTQYI
jgi:hypothetical protein